CISLFFGIKHRIVSITFPHCYNGHGSPHVWVIGSTKLYICTVVMASDFLGDKCSGFRSDFIRCAVWLCYRFNLTDDLIGSASGDWRRVIA
ncbi:MAG: hypothetical protein ACI9NT_002501, partial [Bacteroidia bacterium]